MGEETEQGGMYDMPVIIQDEDKTMDFKQVNEKVKCRSQKESSSSN